MGQAKSVMHSQRVPRKIGEELNIFKYPKEHIKVLIPPSGPSTRISVCRCWRSAKFPICDNSHQILQNQGIKVGKSVITVQYPMSVGHEDVKASGDTSAVQRWLKHVKHIDSRLGNYGRITEAHTLHEMHS